MRGTSFLLLFGSCVGAGRYFIDKTANQDTTDCARTMYPGRCIIVALHGCSLRVRRVSICCVGWYAGGALRVDVSVKRLHLRHV